MAAEYSVWGEGDKLRQRRKVSDPHRVTADGIKSRPEPLSCFPEALTLFPEALSCVPGALSVFLGLPTKFSRSWLHCAIPHHFVLAYPAVLLNLQKFILFC